jgi:hypothetical protein
VIDAGNGNLPRKSSMGEEQQRHTVRPTRHRQPKRATAFRLRPDGGKISGEPRVQFRIDSTQLHVTLARVA